MNRKMTRRARGRKWGCLTTSGLAAAAASADSEASTPARATLPKPQAICRSASRRLRSGQAGSLFVIVASLHVQELIGAEQHLAIALPRRAASVRLGPTV